jgi:sarcosine oxidase, subunit beta
MCLDYIVPMQRYSLLNLVRHSLSRNRGWRAAWRRPSLKKSYDVVVIGGGGHGLATAYFLAKKHGVKRVALLERGHIGQGNSGRNTQVTRSNYFYPVSSSFFDHSLKLYEGLGRELNFNVMLRQSGQINLVHTLHELEIVRRWANAIRMNGVDAEVLSEAEIRKLVPILNTHSRFPILGGLIQRRAGISRHDAVVWGFARGASAHGVDLVQGCEVTGFRKSSDRITGVETSQGLIHCDRVAMSVSNQCTVLAGMAGFTLPISTTTLQAMVTEPIKPILDPCVISASIHAYVSQSDRGEIVIGGAADVYNSYKQRGSLAVTRNVLSSVLELFPSFSRLKLMRQWAGAVDITPDTSPIMGLTPVRNLYINCGWGTGGYKAIPAGGDTMAQTIVDDAPHPLIRAFDLTRFERGALIDEGAASGVAH